MVTRRAADTAAGQILPWLVAAVLALIGSGLIAAWLNATAHNADADTLSRGADAIQSDVEDQVRILELAGTGTRSLAGQSIDEINLSAMVGDLDLSVLRSLLDVVIYPVDEAGTGQVQDLFEDGGPLPSLDYPTPEIDLTLSEFLQLEREGKAFFSAPILADDGRRVDYIVAVPVDRADGRQLVGVVFRPDRMVEAAVEAAGEGQFAVEAVDVRHGQVVASVGEASAPLMESRIPNDLGEAIELQVRPGPAFPFASSLWVPVAVVATGVAIALLLIWMGQMSRARSAELAERLRLAQELNASKDRFLATVSHELRTPLTVVLGVADELGPNWSKFEIGDVTELLEMMKEQAVEASNIVEDLLVAARSDPSQLRLAMEETQLLSHIGYAVGSLPAEGRQRVNSLIHDHPVYADTTRLRQVLRNLLENAVRYGGEEITISCELDGDFLHVLVADNGEGLGVNDPERLFEPYEQAGKVTEETPVGVGIGLYVSRLLARLMHGDLVCMRQNGHTVFRLTLPLVNPDRGSDPALAAAAS